MITLIAVIGPANALGANGGLLYSLRDDMRHFREYTMGHPVIMGRKTYESFPGGPLKDRTNIVVTRRADYQVPDGVVVATSVDDAVRIAATMPGGDEIMVIGGGEIYRQMMPLATDLELTVVEQQSEAAPDTFFPDIAPDEWIETSRTESRPDSRSGIPYRFIHLRR